MKKFIVIIVILLAISLTGIVVLSSKKDKQENTDSKNISFDS